MFKKIFLLGLTFFALNACTFRKLAYSWADSYFLMQVDGSFDLNNKQEAEAEVHISQLLDWHRTNQLPQYIVFVSQFSDRASRTLTHNDIGWVYTEVIRFGNDIAKQVSVVGAPFLTSLETKQFDHLAKNNEKRNKKRFEKYFSGQDKFVQLRNKYVRKHASEWLGSINEKQSEAIQNFSKQVWDFEKLRYENAIQNQNDFLNTIKRKQVPEVQTRLANTFAFPQQFQTEAYRTAYQQNRERITQLVLDLQRYASSDQLAHFQKKLTELRQDFIEMQKTRFL